MKKISALLLGVVALLFFFTGCTKKSTDSPYFIRATVGNTDYYVSGCIIFTSGNAMIIDGSKAAATSPYAYLAINLPGTSLPTQPLKLEKTPGSYGNVYYTSGSSSIAQKGLITITDQTGSSVSGTFSFTCTDGTEVTNGEFTAQRQ